MMRKRAKELSIATIQLAFQMMKRKRAEELTVVNNQSFKMMRKKNVQQS
jgi:hypothetical protein